MKSEPCSHNVARPTHEADNADFHIENDTGKYEVFRSDTGNHFCPVMGIPVKFFTYTTKYKRRLLKIYVSDARKRLTYKPTYFTNVNTSKRTYFSIHLNGILSRHHCF